MDSEGMYSMKEVCEQTGMSYEGLKFYCNQGLVPRIGRDKNNHRVFDAAMVRWIHDLTCLKKCNMSLAEMKEYLALCLEGPSSIEARQALLAVKRQQLVAQLQELQSSIDYINWKENFYNEILTGKKPYVSNLIKTDSHQN